MRTATLGQTGLKVSEVAFGGIPIQRLDHDGAVAVVRGCLDLGINLLDTAHGYTTSEERIGAAIAGRREGLVLASKTPAAGGPEARTHLEETLRRLGVERVDLYQLHGVSDQERWQRVMAPGGALQALQEAQRAGLIGHIGVTSHHAGVAVQAVRSGAFATMMFPLNFVGCEPGLQVLEACRETGVAFLAMKPLGGGMLDDVRAAFQYLRQFPDAIPVVGIEHAGQMAEIVRLYEQPAEITAADRQAMERIRQELGTVFCRRCEYCQPCPAGIRISTVMNVPAMIRRMPAESVLGPGWVRSGVESVAACQDCGECESRCPYHLDIRRRMAEIVTLYQEAARQYLGTRPA